MTTFYFAADAPGLPYGFIYELEGMATQETLRGLEGGFGSLIRAWTFTRELTDDEKDKLVYGATKAEAAEIMRELENDQ